MALSTAADRKDAATIGVPLSAPGVSPDATPGKFWRAASGWSRNLTASPVGEQVPAGSRYWTRGSVICENTGT